ncbi:hypothetical protein MVEN_00073100 [Mycena venus]|uniref:Uncharacterized protein n=1 Tax=Mycena venus TaxID=2733690 RepID=A0A8H6Z7E9_9AGAR|nr:hypothetical protein MVEN_00073100 [Mycena venus]
MSGQLDSTYGACLIALFLGSLLYGMGILQTYIYLFHRPADKPSDKWTVLVVLALETVKVVFFFLSSYFRFVERFGHIQTELIWADSLQLLAAYLSTFTVQVYFASRIHALANWPRSSLFLFGVCLILILALVQISAGIAQTVVSYHLGSYTRLSETTPITTVQSAASLSCDLLIMVCLCISLRRRKGERGSCWTGSSPTL